MKTSPDHNSLSLILERLGVKRSASEAHGLLCGLLCKSKSDKAKVSWFTDLLVVLQTEPDAVEKFAEEIRSLDVLFGHTLEQLNGAMFEFQLLLPPDAALDERAATDDYIPDASDVMAMEHRTRALGEWCRGYVSGVGAEEQISNNSALPADSRELLEDIQEIAKADIERTETTDEGSPDDATDDINWEQTEQDLAELEEYVRVGVLVINEELQPVVGTPGGAATTSLH